jgi:hypothetical protein
MNQHGEKKAVLLVEGRARPCHVLVTYTRIHSDFITTRGRPESTNNELSSMLDHSITPELNIYVVQDVSLTVKTQ